jgi:hypothetical protein
MTWHFDETRVRSYVSLLQEYLRRAALWAKALKATTSWPFFDVAFLVAPTVRAEETIMEALEAALAPQSLTQSMKKTCSWYLHWATVESKCPKCVARYHVPDPFEPLIRFYERGGRFSTEHGFINIGLVAIPASVRGLKEYDSKKAIVSLDERALNRLDAATCGSE